MRFELSMLASEIRRRLECVDHLQYTPRVGLRGFAFMRLAWQLVQLEKVIIGTAAIIAVRIPGITQLIHIGRDQHGHCIHDLPIANLGDIHTVRLG